MVHIVRPNASPHKLLHEVVIFVGASGATGTHNSIRTVFFFNTVEVIRNESNRLIPRRFFKGGVSAALADQGLSDSLGKNLGIIEKIPTVPAFKTGFSVIDAPGRRLTVKDFVRFPIDVKDESASGPAIGANRFYFCHNETSCSIWLGLAKRSRQSPLQYRAGSSYWSRDLYSKIIRFQTGGQGF
jgi:hypothetical protein